ncbi:CARDB domain-containing protein [Natrinema sp. 74]|uniref:CARDB domain-containing protein n=1 Tax=Natrinema sp. 74 TaxID=3384159 RepID=UPI0038D484B1
MIRDSASLTGTYATVVAVAVVTAAVIGATVGVGTVAAQSAPSETGGEYAVIQGDKCYTVDLFGNSSQSIETFYDYRTPNTSPSSHSYSSYGTTHLQEDDTSNLFLYEGSDGVSLVLLHERYDGNTSGGAVTMQFDGLPENGEWVVEDDSYDGRDDEFSHRGSSSRITWVYTDGRNDGAAFRGGLEGEFEITITPAFNDAADFRLYEGQIADWQALSATESGRDRISLDMSKPVTITSGGCPSSSVTDLQTGGTVTPGESVDITATVTNDGERTVTTDVPITVDGDLVDEREVTLEPGETTTLSTTMTFDDAGTYTVAAGDRTAAVTVGETSDGLSGFGVAAVIVMALLGGLAVWHRR